MRPAVVSRNTKLRVPRMHRVNDVVSRTRSSHWVVLGLTMTALVACGGTGGITAATTPPSGPPPATTPPSGPPPTAAPKVNATPQISFSPAQLTVTRGDTVTFAFGSVGHNVFFDNDPAGAPANIPGVNSNTSVDRIFATVGVYTFNCHIHPGMQGTITVVAPDTL